MAAHLTFVPVTRAGVRYSDRSYKSERHFFDFVIDGRSIWDAVGKPRDLVSVLCAEYAFDESVSAVNRLLLTKEADFPSGRRSLFVCSECGDSRCGAITLVVVRGGDAIVWKDFGFENNYDENVNLSEYARVGPFEFEATSYEGGFRQAIESLRALKFEGDVR
jgi:hypothetical protein